MQSSRPCTSWLWLWKKFAASWKLSFIRVFHDWMLSNQPMYNPNHDFGDSRVSQRLEQQKTWLKKSISTFYILQNDIAFYIRSKMIKIVLIYNQGWKQFNTLKNHVDVLPNHNFSYSTWYSFCKLRHHKSNFSAYHCCIVSIKLKDLMNRK